VLIHLDRVWKTAAFAIVPTPSEEESRPRVQGLHYLSMKSTQTTTKSIPAAARLRNKQRFDNTNTSLLFEVPKQNLIQWPSEQEIQQVSKKLARINRVGIRWEANGDYFNSGDLAYQIQEIIRATAELFKKSQRIKH
jgi:hypothetical protein